MNLDKVQSTFKEQVKTLLNPKFQLLGKSADSIACGIYFFKATEGLFANKLLKLKDLKLKFLTYCKKIAFTPSVDYTIIFKFSGVIYVCNKC